MAYQRCHILIQWIVLKRLTLSHDVTRSIYISFKEGHVYAYFLLSKNGELKASRIYLLSYVRKDFMKGMIYINEELSQYENIISVWIFDFRFNVKPSICIIALLHSNLNKERLIWTIVQRTCKQFKICLQCHKDNRSIPN